MRKDRPPDEAGLGAALNAELAAALVFFQVRRSEAGKGHATPALPASCGTDRRKKPMPKAAIFDRALRGADLPSP